jgi:hypothetical protein
MVRRQNTVWRMGMLFAILAAITIVLVLPQVELPSIAFHQSGRSAIHKNRSSAAPTVVVLTARSRFNLLDAHQALHLGRRALTEYPRSTPLPILYSALLC